MFRAYYLVDEMRALGWRCTLLPVQMSWGQRERLIRAERPDVIYLQQCRDPMTQPALYKGLAPTVLDMDDADYADTAVAERVASAVRDATRVVAASESIAAWCKERNQHVDIIWTSHPTRGHAVVAHAQRRPVVAWVQVGWKVYKAEAAFVQEVMLTVARAGIAGLEFHLFDADDTAAADQYVAPLRAAGVRVTLVKRMPNADFLRVLEQAAIGIHVLQPGAPYAHGKSFGKVLSYIVSGAAIVACDPFETSRFFVSGRTAMASQNPADMSRDIIELLQNPQRRQQIADAAYEDFVAKLATPNAAMRLDAILRPMLRTSPRSTIPPNKAL
jgi:hypothetical protein